jgi:hypothetical protein
MKLTMSTPATYRMFLVCFSIPARRNRADKPKRLPSRLATGVSGLVLTRQP